MIHHSGTRRRQPWSPTSTRRLTCVTRRPGVINLTIRLHLMRRRAVQPFPRAEVVAWCRFKSSVRTEELCPRRERRTYTRTSHQLASKVARWRGRWGRRVTKVRVWSRRRRPRHRSTTTWTITKTASLWWCGRRNARRAYRFWRRSHLCDSVSRWIAVPIFFNLLFMQRWIWAPMTTIQQTAGRGMMGRSAEARNPHRGIIVCSKFRGRRGRRRRMPLCWPTGSSCWTTSKQKCLRRLRKLGGRLPKWSKSKYKTRNEQNAWRRTRSERRRNSWLSSCVYCRIGSRGKCWINLYCKVTLKNWNLLDSKSTWRNRCLHNWKIRSGMNQWKIIRTRRWRCGSRKWISCSRQRY